MQILDNVFSLESTEGSYAYLINDEFPVLIDTSRGGKFDEIIEEITSLKIDPKTIKYILLTHHDIDHIGNLK